MSLAIRPALSSVNRILVRGVNWLGDAVMSTPALLRLREAYPGAFIGLVTPDKLVDLWTHHPAVDSVFPFPATETGFHLGRRLREERFDLALILPNSFRSAWECWWARIPRRLGYAGQIRTVLLTEPMPPRPGAVAMRKRARSEILSLTRSRDGDSMTGAHAKHHEGITLTPSNSGQQTSGRGAHHIHQYLHLVARLGANPQPVVPEIRVHRSEVDATLQRLRITRSHGQSLFALNAGAEYGPAKRWPLDRFITAARAIQAETGCLWLVLGGKGDLDLAAEVSAGIASGSYGTGASRATVLNLAGTTSLRELCALLHACDVLLTNDTGPMHVAAAVGTRVVVPFGSTSPLLTGPDPLGENRHQVLASNVPCAPCFLRECPIDFRCMHEVTVEDVVRAVTSRGPARPATQERG